MNLFMLKSVFVCDKINYVLVCITLSNVFKNTKNTPNLTAITALKKCSNTQR